MENNVDALNAIGQNRLEQVYINMPEVHFFFSGDREQTENNLKAYLGGEQLEPRSLQRFYESDGGVYYYLLLDISASISKEEFSDMKDSLSKFCETVRPQDHVVFITFGEEVQTLFAMSGEELAQKQASELILNLENNDQRTLLFEAVHRMSELARSVSADDSTRRVAYVITDGADIAKGKATKEEALKTLQQSGVPVYGFTVESAARESVNSFGEFSRATGGILTILEKDASYSGFDMIREEILQSYEAIFEADSNRVTHELIGTVLEFTSEGEKQQMHVMQDRWMEDQEAPAVKEVISEGSGQIRVVFSERVSGADAAENFCLELEGERFIPVFASLGSDGTSTVLSFSDNLKNGNYELTYKNIIDCSMEENPLEGSAYVEVTGEPSKGEASSNIWRDYGWLAVLLILIFFFAAAFISWKRLKKRQAIVTVEGKALLSSNTEVRHFVSVEKKKFEERKLYFHISGQKEEIPVTIQKSMIVGRSQTCELIFDDPALSRQHFALELKDGKLMIQNLSQSGFTEVNGKKLGAQAYELHSGDEINAGQIKMKIRW